ncbi:MAG: metalloregulator ArsR/SmtB family transcription factor [Acidimicrobiales bacterium]
MSGGAAGERPTGRARADDAVDGAVDVVFTALADATRRELLREVVARAPVTATELAADRAISRQAVAKHLRALEEAGLVTARREGRETRYEADPAPLGAASAWIDATGAAWRRRLGRLRRAVEG